MAKKELLKEYEGDESNKKEVSRSDFPPNFFFGVATSVYQVEGAYKEGGRGPSIWDAFSHTEGKIIDKSNGDVAVDQYHRYKEDVELIAKLGFEYYRFSISWSRIFPDGLGTKINDEGINYYNNLINALLEKGIQPCITLYHWDLPLHLHETMGGWLNKQIVKYFAIYADTCFASFGDRVKIWITINEPLQTAVNGYDVGIYAPGRCQGSSIEPYLAAHHQILAHAAAVSIYRSKYKDKQGGQVGLVLDCEWAEANSEKNEDKTAAARRLDFQLGWYLHPIYFGDYPEVMQERLGDRLPKFSVEEKDLLRNSIDFVGLNHYTSRFIAHVPDSPEEGDFYKAQQMERIVEWEGGEKIGEKAASEFLYVVPWGIRKVLNYIAQRYNNPPIYVTENGMDDEDDETSTLHEMLDDKLRVVYYKRYLAAVAQAIKDGVDVRGYFAWSLLDNFEWNQGYTKRFGLVYVDYKNGLSRHPKSSTYWFLQFLKGGEGKNGKKD
ncbi:beta-glucosidase 42 isoform X1 [Quercus suber]|uniref:beta-glucosidase 42 isoform X1 n=1 Tax=Quercus suber TaxID=58331 RepID=UPI000CE172ED|nr:beta-glucosidase 42-like isoform X1 [Quercus suber]POE70428.1 beta-glucosidase 42 [Quercus suber]